MRLIDTDEFLKRIEWLDEYDFTLYREIKKYLDEMPTIDAEPVRHGRWIVPEKSDFNWECSECGYGIMDNKLTYCSHCGARMESNDEDYFNTLNKEKIKINSNITHIVLNTPTTDVRMEAENESI